jgi:D-alanine-D-alanine ligase
MENEVEKNWWMTIFDDIYLQTDARSVDDHQLTYAETAFIESCLKIQPGWRILDLCGGQGRHALELARRGFLNITVFDYSPFLLAAGYSQATKEQLPVDFMRGDARSIGIQDNVFDFIMLMGSSFGYFTQENENQKILSEAFRLLCPTGIILLDLPDKDHVIHHFTEHSQHQANDQLAVIRDRKLDKDTIYCREKVVDVQGKIIRNAVYCTRLYSQDSIREILTRVGFHKVCFKGDFMCRQDQGDYGCMTNRMLVLAHKP